MDPYIFNRFGLSLVRLGLNLGRRVPQVSGLLTGKTGRVRVNPSRVAGTTGKGRAGTRVNGRGYDG